MKHLKKITISAAFWRSDWYCPFNRPDSSDRNMLLPMHIPVLLCGLICGWQYGGIIGFIMPFLRYALFGMPVYSRQASLWPLK